jgi:hypothetical protein
MSASGPRNYTESRIKHPPRPGGPKFSICLIAVARVRSELDKRGYTQLDIDPKTYDDMIYQMNTQSDGHFVVDQYSVPKLHNPVTKVAFWFSQAGCHSTIIMDGKHYILMGVVRRQTDRSDYNTKSTTLKVREAAFTPEVKEWVDSCIADAMENECE